MNKIKYHKQTTAPANNATPPYIAADGKSVYPYSGDLALLVWPSLQPDGQDLKTGIDVTDELIGTFDFPHSTNQTDLDVTGGSGTGLDFDVTMTAGTAAITIDGTNDGSGYKYHDEVSCVAKTGTVLSGTNVLALCDDTTPTGNDAAFDETITFTGDDSSATCTARVVMADVGGTFTITSLALTSAITGANHTETFSGTADNAAGAGDVTVTFTVTADNFESGTFKVALVSRHFDPITFTWYHDSAPVFLACDYIGSNTTSGKAVHLWEPAH